MRTLTGLLGISVAIFIIYGILGPQAQQQMKADRAEAQKVRLEILHCIESGRRSEDCYDMQRLRLLLK